MRKRRSKQWKKAVRLGWRKTKDRIFCRNLHKFTDSIYALANEIANWKFELKGREISK